MKSIVLASALASVVVAQSSSSNPLIPSGISDSCAKFYGTLNTDTTMTSCLTSLTSATVAFGASANASATSYDVSTALAQLCSSTACTDATLHSQLASFYAACQAELVTTPNAAVLTQYDSLFALAPMKAALCTKDGSSYCVSEIGANVTSSSRKRDTQVVLTPNAATFKADNIAFLRLSPSLPASTLCSACSKAVQQAWITAMNAAAYAPGLASSPMLSGWPALYNGTLTTCGANFLDSTGTNNAGTGGSLGQGVLGQSSGARAGTGASAAGMLGALALAAFAL